MLRMIHKYPYEIEYASQCAWGESLDEVAPSYPMAETQTPRERYSNIVVYLVNIFPHIPLSMTG